MREEDGPRKAPTGVARTAREWIGKQRENPTKSGRLVLLALERRKSGDLDEALDLADRAVEADRKDPMAWSQRGIILFEQGEYNSAVLDFTRAFTLGWDEAPDYILRGRALYEKGRFKETLADADMAVSLDPMSAAGYALRVKAKTRLNYSNEALLDDFKKAAELDPSQYSGAYDWIRARLAQERAATQAARTMTGGGIASLFSRLLPVVIILAFLAMALFRIFEKNRR